MNHWASPILRIASSHHLKGNLKGLVTVFKLWYEMHILQTKSFQCTFSWPQAPPLLPMVLHSLLQSHCVWGHHRFFLSPVPHACQTLGVSNKLVLPLLCRQQTGNSELYLVTLPVQRHPKSLWSISEQVICIQRCILSNQFVFPTVAGAMYRWIIIYLFSHLAVLSLSITTFLMVGEDILSLQLGQASRLVQ